VHTPHRRIFAVTNVDLCDFCFFLTFRSLKLAKGSCKQRLAAWLWFRITVQPAFPTPTFATGMTSTIKQIGSLVKPLDCMEPYFSVFDIFRQFCEISVKKLRKFL